MMMIRLALQGANYNSITCHKLSYKSNFCNGDDNYDNDGHDNEDNDDDDDDDDDDYHRRESQRRDSLRKDPCHQVMHNVNYHGNIIIVIILIIIQG